MLTKLWSLLMLKLSRLIVAVKNAFRKKDPSEGGTYEIGYTATYTDAEIKAICEGHDYCEQCEFYVCFGGCECLLADDDEGIPCYWEVDE